MERTIAIDTETFRFGEQPDGSFVVIPRMICTSWAVRTASGIESHLVSDGDGDQMRARWEAWLASNALLVFHNAAYDLGVCAITYPELEPAIWAKLRRGEVTDTKLREKLLALSTHGSLESVELPDGSKEMLAYGLDDLARRRLGLDLSEDKHGEDSVRTHYDLYAGTPAAQYPPSASHYAKQDAHVTLAIHESQQADVRNVVGHASVQTEFFQTACDFSLFLMTAQGMPINEDTFRNLYEEMQRILSEDNLRPLIRAGILRPAEPARPNVRQINRALESLDELGHPGLPEIEGGYDWSALTADWRAVLEDEGIKFTKPKDASINRKELCARVEAVCKAIGTKPKKTASGGICADSEVIADLHAFDEHLELEPGDEDLPDGTEDGVDVHPRRMTPLENYQYRQAVSKIVSTELPRMMWGPEGEETPAKRVYFNFNALLSTGRTSSFASSHFPSANGQNVDPRARPCYEPEDGFWLLSTDYSGLELCSVAQTTYDLFGESRHRDLINRGFDLHCNLGGSLCARLPSPFVGNPADLEENYHLFRALKVTDEGLFGHWRKFAKPVGLGYPGGLGAATFMSLAKKAYGVNIMKAAADFPIDQLPGPENSTVRWHAERVGVTEDNWEWTPYVRGVALSVLLKEVWLDTYPEMRPYFEWVTQQKDEHNVRERSSGEIEHMLCYTTPLGMHRAGCTFTAAANGRAMQSPAAEGAKAAVFQLMEECRIGRLRGIVVPHIFVHDEIVASVRIAEAQHAIAEVERIMIEAMQNVMPDVRISVESALMEQWHKAAAPVRDRSTNNLVPWRPDVKFEKDADGNLWLPTAA